MSINFNQQGSSEGRKILRTPFGFQPRTTTTLNTPAFSGLPIRSRVDQLYYELQVREMKIFATLRRCPFVLQAQNSGFQLKYSVSPDQKKSVFFSRLQDILQAYQNYQDLKSVFTSGTQTKISDNFELPAFLTRQTTQNHTSQDIQQAVHIEICEILETRNSRKDTSLSMPHASKELEKIQGNVRAGEKIISGMFHKFRMIEAEKLQLLRTEELSRQLKIVEDKLKGFNVFPTPNTLM